MVRSKIHSSKKKATQPPQQFNEPEEEESPPRQLRPRKKRGQSSRDAPPPQRTPTPPRRSPSPTPSPPTQEQVPTLPRPIFTDGVHERNYQKLESKLHEGTRALSLGVLQSLGILDMTRELLNNVGWLHFSEMRLESYPSVSIEFLHAFEFEEREQERGYGVYEFRFLNTRYQFPFARINEIFGWPVDAPVPFENTFDVAAAWKELTGQDHYQPSISKASALKHPCLRILHKFIAKSLLGRVDSDGAVVIDELRILWGMVHRKPFDTAYILGKKLKRALKGKTIMVGGFIARIVHVLCNFDPLANELPSVSWEPIGQSVLMNMHIMEIHRGHSQLKPPYAAFIANLRQPAPSEAAEGESSGAQRDVPMGDVPVPSPPRRQPTPPPPADPQPPPSPAYDFQAVRRDIQAINERLDENGRQMAQFGSQIQEFGEVLQHIAHQQAAFFQQHGFQFGLQPPPGPP